MKALARRLAVPALLFLAVLAGGTLALNAWNADAQELPPEDRALPMQITDDGGVGFISDADEDDAPGVIDGGIDDAIMVDMELMIDAPLVDAAPIFFDATEPPGGQPGTGPGGTPGIGP